MRTIGVLGGGQLSRMLIEATARVSARAVPLCDSAEDPAAQIAPTWEKGHWSKINDLKKLLKNVEIVTFENEFIDVDHLRPYLARHVVRPSLDAVHSLQNKLRQKTLLTQLGIPTSEYDAWKGTGDWRVWIKEHLSAWKGEGVLKWAQFGYDGYGTLMVSERTPLEDIANFFEKARAKGTEVFIEKKIPFARELAIAGCRSVKGEWICYPVVVSRQEGGVCREVHGPASAYGLSAQKCVSIESMLKAVAFELPLEGILAMELFETQSGEVLVNELAPRVHNSAHYTQDACDHSQFENHLRAVLDLPLGKPGYQPYFGMVNILGTREAKAPRNLELPPAPLHLHWYGKSQIRPGRKMGHVNFHVSSAKELSRLQERARSWVQDLRL